MSFPFRLLTGIALLSASFLSAQEIELDPITVTATITQKRASETGRDITIIKGEQFQHLPVHSLDDLLRYVSGVEIQARGPMGSQSDIVIRGGTFQQALVILDGLRLNDPNTGHFNSYIPIAPYEIDRIEILKGASSAIHGPDAVGGVINIITKTFAEKQRETKTDILTEISAGEYDFLNANAGFYLSKNKWSVGGGVLSNHASGVQQRGTQGFFHNTTASLSADYHFDSAWSIAYRTAYDQRRFSAQNFYTPNLSDTATEQVRSFWNQVSIRYQQRNQRLTLNAGIKNMDDNYSYNRSLAPNQNHSRILQALLMYQNRLNAKTTLVSGFNFQQKSISSNDRGDHSIYLASPFVSFSWQMLPRLILHPSVQVVMFEGLSAELVPQLDLSYKKDDWQFRGSIGKTVRDADFTERYNNYNKVTIAAGQRVGYPDLVAERSLSYEAGVDRFFQDRWKVSATFFQRFQRRLIDYSNTKYDDMPRKDNLIPGGTYALAKNIAAVNTSGFEADVRYRHDISNNQQLEWAAGFIALKSRDSDTLPSFYISSHARFLVNFTLAYHYKNLSASVIGLYKERQSQYVSAIQAHISPDYFVVGARVAYALLRDRWGIFVQADNILDRQYSDLLGAPMPGRWLMMGVKWQWNKKENE